MCLFPIYKRKELKHPKHLQLGTFSFTIFLYNQIFIFIDVTNITTGYNLLIRLNVELWSVRDSASHNKVE